MYLYFCRTGIIFTMFKKYYVLYFLLLSIFLVPSISNASIVTSYKLNGEAKSINFNPATDKVSIAIETSVPVSFSTIAICVTSDSVCSRSTSVKYFTQTGAYITTVSKDWDGKTGGASPTQVPDGDYKLRLTMKDSGGASIDEILDTYLIKVSSTIVADPGTGDSTSTATTTATTTSSTATTTDTTISPSGGITYVSSHSSYSDLSYYEPLDLKTNAGRSRMAFLHNLIIFKTKAVDKNGNNVSGGVTYTWSLGDGTSQSGAEVSHMYVYPGVYNVVLNVKARDEETVSRTKVVVINPDVTFSYSNGSIEAKNNLKDEVNIGDWIIVPAVGKKFVIAKDTIVGGENSIKIPFENLVDQNVLILNPDLSTSSVFAVYDKERIAKVAWIQEQLAYLQRQSGSGGETPHDVPVVEYAKVDDGDATSTDVAGVENLASASALQRTVIESFLGFIKNIFH